MYWNVYEGGTMALAMDEKTRIESGSEIEE